MKTVKRLSDAAGLAARYGGALELDGQRINVGGDKVSVLRPRQAPAAPTPAPEPPPAPAADVHELIAAQGRLIERQGNHMAAVIATVLDRLQPSPAPPAAQPRRPASFKVLRNSKGEASELAVVYEDGPVSAPLKLVATKRGDGLIDSITPVYG